MSNVPIIDITNKESFKCPKYGFINRFPKRTISIQKLKHMQEAEGFAEWERKQGIKSAGIANPRLMVCLQCRELIICTDRFSKTYLEQEKEHG